MSDDRTGRDGGRNVLALSATSTPDPGDLWQDLHRRVARSTPPPETIVTVSYSRTPDEWAGAVLGDRSDVDGVDRVLISVGDPTRGGCSAGSSSTGEAGDAITVATVDDATDPDELYETVRRFLEPSPGDAGSAGRTRLSFESVGELIDRVGIDGTVDLLGDVTDLVVRAGAEGYYLFDPAEHDPAALGAISPLFDGVEHVPSGRDGERARLAGDDPSAAGPATETATGADAGADPGSASGLDSGIDPGPIHDALRSERRRRILYTLVARPEGVEIRSLADRLATDAAAAEGNGEASETTDEIRVSLAHVDLPKLEETELVERDADERIRATERARAALPYLRLDAIADGVDLDADPVGGRLGGVDGADDAGRDEPGDGPGSDERDGTDG